MYQGTKSGVFLKLHIINNNWLILKQFVEKYADELTSQYILFRNDKISDTDFNKYLVTFVLRHKDEINSLSVTAPDIDPEILLKKTVKNLISKTGRMKKTERKKGTLPADDITANMEAAFKSSFYIYLRHLYNNIERYNINKPFATAIFYFIREYCYSSMFRYNKSGGFNVPYGGMTYNRKDFTEKIKRLTDKKLVERLNKTTIGCMDFEDFLEGLKPSEGDFIFIDPPYDTGFSTYAKNTFDQNDQIRLANYLKNTRANFMAVIKNTDFIYSLYKDFNIKSFGKKYLVSFQNRNDKEAEHLLITNY